MNPTSHTYSTDILDLPPAKTAFADIETTRFYKDGSRMVMPARVHYLICRDRERKITRVFGPGLDSLEAGVRWLERCERVIFHNGLAFDALVLEHHFQFDRRAMEFLDSIVLLRLFHANIKEKMDFELAAKHAKRPPQDIRLMFTKNLIGKHALEAWGLRLKSPFPKGDYAKRMELLGRDPWAEPNPEMLEYGIDDVILLERIWDQFIEPNMTPDNRHAIRIEHFVQTILIRAEHTGIPFDTAAARRLAEELEGRALELEEQIQKEFPPRLEPLKWVYNEIPVGKQLSAEGKTRVADLEKQANMLRREISDLENDDDDDTDTEIAELSEELIRIHAEITDIWRAEGTEQVLSPLMRLWPKNLTYRYRFNLPEGYQREQWGEVFEPKVNRNVKDKEGNITFSATVGQPYVKVGWIGINPRSRQQLSRRLVELGWKPVEFTKTGYPKTSEVELTKLAEEIPVTKTIATYLMIQKRIGALLTGKNAWLNLVDSNGLICPTTTTCATVTFRGTHAEPNISQTPSVNLEEYEEAGKKKKRPLKGERGKWGWDCRALFHSPRAGFVVPKAQVLAYRTNGLNLHLSGPGINADEAMKAAYIGAQPSALVLDQDWIQVGSDLEGIEMRCWAHYLYPHDGGAFADLILSGRDIHEENRVILGFSQRRKAKEWLYAMMYGGGDPKLGFIIEPLATVERQKKLGLESRLRFMKGFRGYKELDAQIAVGVRRGFLWGLDGRKIPVRKQHAGLNALLQSAGAVISKYWIRYMIDELENKHGLRWGYDADYSLLLYSHDELQWACRPEHEAVVKASCKAAAARAQEYLKFKLPVGTDEKAGTNWGDTH